MGSSAPTRPTRRAASIVRSRVEQGDERLWQFRDFADLPFPAVAQALSRLVKAGQIERLSKGVYYRTRATTFGPSRPNPAAVRALVSTRAVQFPAGLAAANLLGFTTQTSRHAEVATTASSLPRKLIGTETVVHTRRPAAWAKLTAEDAALLDFLRQGGRASELTPENTIRRTLALLAESDRYGRLAKAAPTEPPRVRALLGALGEALGADAKTLLALRITLNPLSKFRFGTFVALPMANAWQAKEAG